MRTSCLCIVKMKLSVIVHDTFNCNGCLDLPRQPFFKSTHLGGAIMIYDSTNALDIAEAISMDLNTINNQLFPKLGNGYFSKEDERMLERVYRTLADTQADLMSQLRERRY